MSRAAKAQHALLCLGLLVLVAGVFTLSLQAKAWVDSSQHHLAKHYKVLDPGERPIAAIAPPIPAGIEPVHFDCGHAPPAAGNLAPRSEPFQTSHPLRAPPSVLV